MLYIVNPEKEISAGLLMYRKPNKKLEVFLVHPGGPYFRNKDNGVWGIPKGWPEPGEKLFAAAVREFSEETGLTVSQDKIFLDLGSVIYLNGKTVFAWAFEDGNFDPEKLTSNTFEMEWPPKSGKRQKFPEIDRGNYFILDRAAVKILPAQKSFLTRLEESLNIRKQT